MDDKWVRATVQVAHLQDHPAMSNTLSSMLWKCLKPSHLCCWNVLSPLIIIISYTNYTGTHAKILSDSTFITKMIGKSTLSLITELDYTISRYLHKYIQYAHSQYSSCVHCTYFDRVLCREYVWAGGGQSFSYDRLLVSEWGADYYYYYYYNYTATIFYYY